MTADPLPPDPSRPAAARSDSADRADRAADRAHPDPLLLDEAETARLRVRSDRVGVALVAHAWLLIAGAMALFATWPNPLTFLVAVAVIGNRQLGLAILMHDASHRLLFASPRLNDWVGTWLCGAPVGASLSAYRPYHLTHHRHTQTERDPDLVLSAPFPITPQSFRRKVVRDLLGVTGYQRRVVQFRAAMGDSVGLRDRVSAIWRAERSFLIAQAVLLGVLAALGQAWLFLLLWVVPLLTWYQLVSRIRNIAEHAVVGPADDPLRNTRTTYAGPLMRLFVAPYWVNYHLEHHLLVYTPCWKLPKAHRMLLERGLGPRMEIGESYAAVLRKAVSRPRDSDRRGKRRETFAQL
jgi:fatty acid desaturase